MRSGRESVCVKERECVCASREEAVCEHYRVFVSGSSMCERERGRVCVCAREKSLCAPSRVCQSTQIEHVSAWGSVRVCVTERVCARVCVYVKDRKKRAREREECVCAYCITCLSVDTNRTCECLG